jgi:septum formation protein
MRLILASASPRRAELLRAAGFDFETLAVSVDEAVRAGESAAAYVGRLAEEKAETAWRRLGLSNEKPAQDFVVIGADTTVVAGNDILGKPRDDREAEAMLRQLSGRRHEVLTGVSLRSTSRTERLVETTAVFFDELRPDDIAWYVASGEGKDKAGGYAVQGLAARFVTRIEGSYTNVVGLPVHAVHRALRTLASGL